MAIKLFEIKRHDRPQAGKEASNLVIACITISSNFLLQGCTEMTILNRSHPRAEDLAAEFPEADIQIRLMPELMATVAESDVVFVASGSESILIRGDDIRDMPRASDSVGGERRFFDISVPRNVDPDCSDVAASRVFNVDDLKEVIFASPHRTSLP